jgi:hypothetical protein
MQFELSKIDSQFPAICMLCKLGLIVSQRAAISHGPHWLPAVLVEKAGHRVTFQE